MKLIDWLFGEPTRDLATNAVQVRSVTIEPDTVHEILGILRSVEAGVAITTVQRVPGPGLINPREAVPDDKFEGLPNWQRKDLQLQDPAGGSLMVDLRQSEAISVIDNSTGDHELMGRVAAKLAADGTPRLRRVPILVSLPWLIFLAAGGCWIWFWAATTPPLPEIIFGWLVLVALSPTANTASNTLLTKYSYLDRGVRIRSVSREELRRTRADRNADRRASIWAAVVITPVTVVITLVVQHLAT